MVSEGSAGPPFLSGVLPGKRKCAFEKKTGGGGGECRFSMVAGYEFRRRTDDRKVTEVRRRNGVSSVIVGCLVLVSAISSARTVERPRESGAREHRQGTDNFAGGSGSTSASWLRREL